MEPMKPEDKARILQTRPLAQPADIEEYERLLAERFTRDPSVAAAPPIPRGVSAAGPLSGVPSAIAEKIREDRITELFQKLFG